MPRIDPERLLKCLNPLLDPSGAIKSDKEVDKIYGLMSKFSKKLVSKCMYLNILKSTPDDILDLFMQRGGWEMVFSWTAEASENKNYALLTEIAYLLLKTPATTNRLKENELPKIIKALSRDSQREETKNVAKQVFFKWMSIAKSEESTKTMKPLESSEITNATFNLSTVNINVDPNMNYNDDVVIIESEMPQNEFDVNIDLGNADLNELEFNPDVFNNTVDQHLGEIVQFNTSAGNSDQSKSVFAADSTSTLDDSVEVEVTEIDSDLVQDQPQSIIVQTSTSEQNGTAPTAQNKITPYALVMRNGKHYLMKIQQVAQQPVVETVQEEDAEDHTPRKRPRKDPTIKRPNILVSAGKPSMKTYGLKVKTAEAVALQAIASRNEKPGKKIISSEQPVAAPKKDTSRSAGSSSSAFADAKKASSKTHTRSKSTSSKSVLEAAKQEADDEKFRKKMAEQKKLLDVRKKEAEKEKLQKERDEATLKALKLSGAGTKIPKIPKKSSASFSDMIGIPGVKDDSKVELKKIKKRNSLDGSSPVSSDKSPTKSSTVKPKEEETLALPVKERRHRPKVYNNTKSRSLSLLEDMELTLKEKERPIIPGTADEKIKDDEITALEKEPGRISSKSSKRPSTDSLTKPGDTKKSKSSNEKEKDKREKDAKKKDKDEKELKMKEKESSSSTKKVVGIQESSLFMAAITASASSTKNAKRKRRTSSSGDNGKEPEQISKTKNTSSKGKSQSPTEETDPVKPVFNFYRDTLADGESEVPSRKEKDEESAEDKNSDEKQSDEDRDAFEPEEGEGMLKSALILHRSKNKVKKTVHWKEEEYLKEYHFFDLDETERVNVARQNRNFTEMKQIERSEERKIIRRNLFGVVDIMEEKTGWKTPLPFIITTDLPDVPLNSSEKSIQEEREKGILEVFYFSRNQIPDSADDSLITPNYDLTPPVIMTWEDVNGVTKVVEAEAPPSDVFNKVRIPDIVTKLGIGNIGGVPPPIGKLDSLHINGFGFNVPPPGYNAPLEQQTPFNSWNNSNPFGMPIPGPGTPDIWNMNGPQVEMPSFQNFGNPNMNMMGGMPGQGPQFPVNPSFGFPPPFRGAGPCDSPPPHGPPPMGVPPPRNRFDGPPRGSGHLRGRGFGGRDRGDYNRDVDRDRDFRRDRERDRDRDMRGDRDRDMRGDRDRDMRNDRDKDRYDRHRDGRDNRDRGGRDRGSHDYTDNRQQRRGPGGRIPCRFFSIGKCKLGDKCDYLHTSGSQDSERDRSSSRSSRHIRTDSPTLLARDDQEDWDAETKTEKSKEAAETNTVVESTDNNTNEKGHDNDITESRFSLPPSSPDCLPPGTESPVVIPVIAQTEENGLS